MFQIRVFHVFHVSEWLLTQSHQLQSRCLAFLKRQSLWLAENYYHQADIYPQHPVLLGEWRHAFLRLFMYTLQKSDVLWEISWHFVFHNTRKKSRCALSQRWHRQHSARAYNLEHGEEKTQITKTALKFIYTMTLPVLIYIRNHTRAHAWWLTSIVNWHLFLRAFRCSLRPIVKTDERVANWGKIFIKACRPWSEVPIATPDGACHTTRS